MAVVFAFACAVVYGVGDYCGGRASRTAPSLYVTFIVQVSSLALAALAVAISSTAFPDAHDVAWSVVAGFASALALACFYTALSRGAMTVVAPTTAVTSAVIPVVVGLAEGERPSGLAYFGMVLAVVAVALVSGAIGQRHIATRASTIGLAFVAGLGFALIFIAFDRTGSDSGLWPLLISRSVSIALVASVAVMRRGTLSEHRSAWKLPALAGVLDMSANLLYLLAIRRGLLSVVVVVAALYPVSTVLLAFGLDRERVSRSQAVGMVLAIGALVLVSVSGAA